MKLLGGFIVIAATFLVRDVLLSDNSLVDELLVTSIVAEIDAAIRSDLDISSSVERLIALNVSSLLRVDELTDAIDGRASLRCIFCKSLVNVIMNYIKEGMDTDSLKNIISNLCITLELSTEDICNGVVELNAAIVVYIVDNNPNLTAASVCGVAYQTKSCELTAEEFEWTVELDDGDAKYISSEEVDKTIRIVQISDLHYDAKYQAYGNAECDEPICCRKGQNRTNTSGKIAGYWGDYNDCDTPWHALVNMMNQIKNEEQEITYIYFTGDVVDHGVWETSRSGNIEGIARSYAQLYETFGSLAIYPILGNHEPNPVNVFAPSDVTDDELSTSWLYNMVANIWIDFGWLPESTRSTILQGGFYTVSPRTGFRVIALNNNVCYTYNWWLLHQPQDPSGQLKWLAETLLQAENDGEYVHILAHMPPGSSSCQYTWGREYRRVVNRFAHIISAEFNGHTHNDEIRVIYDLDNTTNAIRVAWNGGSATSYSNLNPNYKVYTVNANTYVVEDAETWIYNLTLANETPEDDPVWFKSYSFMEEYELEDLSLSSLNDLVLRMAYNSSILSSYYNHYVKEADPLLAKGCDESCLTNQLCKIVTAAADDSTQCEYFTTLT